MNLYFVIALLIVVVGILVAIKLLGAGDMNLRLEWGKLKAALHLGQGRKK